MERQITPAEQIIRARFDDKRFPKMWQAMVGASAMQIVGVAAMFFTGAVFFGSAPFRTEFGYNMFLAILSQFFCVLIIPLFVLLITKKDLRATLRLHKSIDAAQVVLLASIALGVFLAAQIVNAQFIERLSSVLGPPAEDESGLLSAQTIPQLMFQLVVVGGLPAICEEIFFRGFVMRAFERLSPVAAILLSSVVFAVMHANLEQLVYAFLIGLILGTVTMLTDSLLAGTVVHFTLNATSSILMYPPVNEWFSRLEENDLLLFGATGVMLVFGAACLAAFILYTRKKNTRLFGAPFTSDLCYPRLMPRQKTGEKVGYVFGWIGFVLLNLLFMGVIWAGNV